MIERSGLQIKGSALKAITTYVQQRFGGDTHAQGLAALPEDERVSIEHLIPVSSWYDIELFESYITAIAESTSIAKSELAHEMGKFSAEYGARGVYALFVRLGSPEFVVGRAGKVWKSYYSRGELQVTSADRCASLELRDVGYSSDILCPRLSGWMQRILELSGAKNVAMSHDKCVRLGDPCCAWSAHWK